MFGVTLRAQDPAAQPQISAAQEDASPKPQSVTAEKDTAAAKPDEKPALPFQIQLLETKVRFEVNGDSRKDVHTIVKINDAGGARQFARLAFEYNRGWQQVEIPSVRITHANGGTSEILPSAITDAVNPAVEKYPAYQDLRVKAVRILGLQEGDILEYRVVTTGTHAPYAPDFWLTHSFDRSGQVVEEKYEIDLPARCKISINPETRETSRHTDGSGDSARQLYAWQRTAATATSKDSSSPEANGAPDIAVSSTDWEYLAVRLSELLLPGAKPLAGITGYEESLQEMRRRPEVTAAIKAKAISLTESAKGDANKLRAIYSFVATKITTVDLPPGATGFSVHSADEVLRAGYANGEDKYVLFAALSEAVHLSVDAALGGFCDKQAEPNPFAFKRLLVVGRVGEKEYWLDPVAEVAPFGMVLPIAGKCALLLDRGIFALNSTGHEWATIPNTLPFAAIQKATVDASVNSEGNLFAKVKYAMRGQNELTLRQAFHKTEKEHWKEVAGLLALADGFRGQIASVNVSDPLATEKPFEVEYELTQPKFVDWAKKPVRIPALLPQIALPDSLGGADSDPRGKIELGTPLDVETHLALRLPMGTTVQTPSGTSVTRDYATFSSKYDGHLNTAIATRSVHFLVREIPADRAVDYNAFIRAVQNDQAQAFVLFPPAADGSQDKKAQ